MKDKVKFKEFMVGLGLIFDKDIPAPLSSIYWKTLQPYTDQECEKTFNRLISTCKFFPKPAEFLEILKGTTEDNGIQAWQKVMGILGRGGKSADDYQIDKAVNALGGWSYLGQQTYDELKWTEKRFREHYEVISERELIEYPPEVEALLERPKPEIDIEQLKLEAMEYVRIKYGDRIKNKDRDGVEKEIRDFISKKTGNGHDFEIVGSILRDMP